MRAGEADHVLFLCRRLAERGLAVEVLTGQRPVPGRLPFKVTPVVRTWSWSGLPTLAVHMRRSAPDAVLLVHSDWIYGGHPMIAFAPALARRLLPAVPFVTQLETESVSLRASVVTRAVLKAMGTVRAVPSNLQYVVHALVVGSDRVIVLSEHHRLRLLERFRDMAHRVIAIPPPPLIPVCEESRARARARLGLKPDEFIIVYFGFVDPTKGVETLFEALRVVTARRSGVRLVMVGGGSGSTDAAGDRRAAAVAGYEQAMRRMPAALGCADRVTWTGGYDSDSDDASLHLRAADACVLPYDRGILLNRSSFAAAAAHGLPIVTTRGAFLESAFRDRENVLLCPPRDPERLGLAIEELIGSAELRERLGAGALELARQWFSWDTAVGRTIDALRSGRPRAASRARA